MKSRANTEDPAAYRLEELTVTIVSMVDSPAIGREFLLMKRQEEDTVAKKDEELQPEKTPVEDAAEETAAEEAPTEAPVSKEEPAVVEAEKEAAPAASKTQPVAEATVAEPLTVASALSFLVEHKSELPRPGQVAVAMLDRQKQDQDTTDFNTAYAAQDAGDDIWTCLWVLMDVIGDVLEGDIAPKLPLILAAIQAFGTKVVEVLGEAGVKSAEPVKVKLGDVEVEVADEFQGQVLAGMADLAEQLAALKEEREQPTEKRDGEEEAVQSGEAPLTANQVLKMIREGIAEARRPIYKSIAVDDEDTQEPKTPKRKSRTERPGDTYSPGLAGMQRR